MYSQDCKAKIDGPLYVITVISNSWRYHSRYSLYYKFKKHMEDSGVPLYTVEVAFGDRHHVITERANKHHLQLRTPYELWYKENMINLGIQQLPPDWKYVAWIDADITFARPDWVEETLHRLQHYSVLQLFSQAQDMSPSYDVINVSNGFVYSHVNNEELPPFTDSLYSRLVGILQPKNKWHPGYAWAIRRDAFDALGGLIDCAILGAGDQHMARALIGRVATSYNPGISNNYKKYLKQWEDRATKHIRRNIGFVPGMIMHAWHGKKSDRKYGDRWQILVDCGYDPEADIKKDWQGLWQLTDRSIELRDGIRNYFAARNEDSIDLT